MMLKPDALSGPYALIEVERCSDFFRCLALSLSHQKEGICLPDDLQLPSSVGAATSAWQQCVQRSKVEEGFIMAPWLISSSQCVLNHYADVYRAATNRHVSTKHILTLATRACGCPVLAEYSGVVSPHDLQEIYADLLQQTPEAEPHLMQYLVGQEVCLFLLGGNPIHSALQRLKIYARYFLRYRFQDPLPDTTTPSPFHHNLLHIPDRHEQARLHRFSVAFQKGVSPHAAQR
jgi:hypothetical protein